jgi:IS30 family transposase
MILNNPNKQTKPVMGKNIKAIKSLPRYAHRSISFNRGSEFMNWPQLQVERGRQYGSAIYLQPSRKAPLRTPING